MTADVASGLVANTVRSFVVGERLRVTESGTSEVEVGAELTASSWFGPASLRAIEALRQGVSSRHVARDVLRGTHWLVEAALLGEEPWRARVSMVDVTFVIREEQTAFLEKLVHSMRNLSFGLLTVVDALALDRPTGSRLDEYLMHLRNPAERIAAIMTGLSAYVSPGPASIQPFRVSALVEICLARTDAACRPLSVTVPTEEMTLLGDIELLAETTKAMVESGGGRASSSLAIERVEKSGRAFVRIVVERASRVGEENNVAALWDLAFGVGLEVPLRLSVGRAIVMAHGGDVLAVPAGPGRLRLGFELPITPMG